VTTAETFAREGNMVKRWLLALVLALSLPLASILLAPAPVAADGTFHCSNSTTEVDGVSEEQAVLFVQVGFVCLPQ
jgi:hypothetical protein